MIVKGRCASSFSSCSETPAKGGDSKSMSQLPHSCGPERMGLGWKDGMKKQKKSLNYEDWMPGGEEGLRGENVATVMVGTEIVWGESKTEEKSRVVRIGERIVIVEREAIKDLKEEEPEEVKSQNEFEGEVLTGPRIPKMVEVLQYNTDEPGAGKHTRLVLEDFTKVPPPGRAGLIWCGTSLSDQALNTVECTLNSRFSVEFSKAFTINSMGATYKPELNAVDVLRNKIKMEKIRSRNVAKYQFLIFELGVNEVTDAKGQNEINSKMKALVNLADDIYKTEKLHKVILLNRLPRCDDKRKAALSLFSNKAMQSALQAKGTVGIEIRDLALECESKQLFGSAGVKDYLGRSTDNLHFRGPNGPKAFNDAAIRLLNTL